MKYFKITILSSIFFIILLVDTYFPMLKFSKEISSSCIECSFLRDVLLLTLVGTIFLIIIFLIVRRLFKNKILFFIVFFSFFFLSAFLINYNIFVDRVSSWSTFSIQEEVLSVISLIYLYLIVSLFLLGVLFRILKC